MKQAVNILEVSFRIVGVSDEDLQKVGEGMAAVENKSNIDESMQAVLNTIAKIISNQDVVNFIGGTKYKPFLDTRTGGKIIYNGAEKSLTIDFQGVVKEKKESVDDLSFTVAIGDNVPVVYWYLGSKGMSFRVRRATLDDVRGAIGFENTPIEKCLVVVGGSCAGNVIHVDHVLSDTVKIY